MGIFPYILDEIGDPCYEDRGVPLQDEYRSVFVKTEHRPRTSCGLGLPDEVWIAVLSYICITIAFAPHVDVRTRIVFSDLSNLDNQFADDYTEVVEQRNILR